MSARRAAAVALLAVLGALAAVPAISMGSASGAAGAPVAGPPAALTQGANATNASLGTHVAAFVTAGVETAGENVERRMWQAAYDDTDNRSSRAHLVTERTATLETRLADLEADKRDLLQRRESGEISTVVYRARMSALAARLSALRASINDTAPRAAAVGADASRVQALRERARNASGPELRQARSLGGGPPDGTPPGLAGTPPGQGEGPPGQGPSNSGGPPGEGGPSTGTDTPDCPGNAPDDPGSAPDDSGPRDC